jgi:predicted metalloprotease with PDZ domain
MTGNRLVAIAALLFPTLAIAQSKPVLLRVDFTDAPRHLFHITEQLPVHPGPNTLFYPKWVPGQEMPTGPIDNLTGLTFHADSPNGTLIPWRRDLVDMYAFYVNVPDGVATLVVSFDVLDTPSHTNTTGTLHTSSHVVMLEPSQAVLYPDNPPVYHIPITASIHLPAGWSAATALRTDASAVPALNGPDTTFKTVSLEQFVDSPILAGDHCRQYPLAPEIHPVHTLDVCADKASELDLQPAFLAHMTGLVQQSTRLFVGHHFEHYDYLLAASPHLQGDSEEHTQSADYIVRSIDTTNPAVADNLGGLISHEFTHAWCGKYRRPAGDATPDFQQPMQNDLLWVYEGFTQYYGDVLTARAGFRTPADSVSIFDYAAFSLDKPGRRWRSIQETADASAILRAGDSAWANWRLDQDYYYAGSLLWLEADMKIRQLTHGRKSLDDFAAQFFAPPIPASTSRDTGPGVLPFTFANLIQTLNAIAPYDWQDFWITRLNALTMKSLTGGLEAAGYQYIESENPAPGEADFLKTSHVAETYHSLGFQAAADGTLQDVWIGSPASIAGLGPGDKLTAVNGKPYTSEALTTAIREAKTTTTPIALTAARDDESMKLEIQYHGGEKYAALVRDNNPDILTTSILQPK